MKIPSSTVDIYPTLLEITGVKIEEQPVLDGISLLPTIQNSNDLRSKPIGFWQYPIVGKKVPGHEWMVELLKAQESGNIVTDSTMLDLYAGKIDSHYPEDSFPGHAAWLDWPYKLHRIHEPFSGKIINRGVKQFS